MYQGNAAWETSRDASKHLYTKVAKCGRETSFRRRPNIFVWGHITVPKPEKLRCREYSARTCNSLVIKLRCSTPSDIADIVLDDRFNIIQMLVLCRCCHPVTDQSFGAPARKNGFDEVSATMGSRISIFRPRVPNPEGINGLHLWSSPRLQEQSFIQKE